MNESMENLPTGSPIDYVTSTSTNPPLRYSSGTATYYRIDSALDSLRYADWSPKFLRWYKDNMRYLESKLVFYTYNEDYFSVLGSHQDEYGEYPVFANCLNTRKFEYWLMTYGFDAARW